MSHLHSAAERDWLAYESRAQLQSAQSICGVGVELPSRVNCEQIKEWKQGIQGTYS